MRHLIYICTVFAVMIINCSCYRNIRYVVDDKTPLPHEYIDSTEDYRIKSGDIIGINLISTNKEINEMFSNNESYSPRIGNQQNSSSRGGYIVSDSGYVLLPIFGNIRAEGKTITQIRGDVQLMADRKLIDAVVTANLLNFDVYFLGASQNTKINFDRTHVNILEAVAQAGGINYDGKRRKIMVIRKTITGHSIYRIDITDRKIMEASRFYLQPNDIVYIEPRRFAAITNGLKNYTTVLSIVSSALTTYYLISRLK
ncbi:MAG: polysaccharide biosynthesis/export family protein [Bacteroidales bacterium]|nr:polysaccharide biosynthesis/export family protein [Bacteroidales bacterium]